jgi:hypothetical protein
MRGNDDQLQSGMFSYVSLEERIPAAHPLRGVRFKVLRHLGQHRIGQLAACARKWGGRRFRRSGCFEPCCYILRAYLK